MRSVALRLVTWMRPLGWKRKFEVTKTLERCPGMNLAARLKAIRR